MRGVGEERGGKRRYREVREGGGVSILSLPSGVGVRMDVRVSVCLFVCFPVFPLPRLAIELNKHFSRAASLPTSLPT